NLITGNTGGGVNVATPVTVTLDHNTIAGNGNTGVYASSSSQYASSSVTIQNNIVASNNGFGVARAAGSAPGVYLTSNDVWGHAAGNYSNTGGALSANPLFAAGSYRITSRSPCRFGDSTGGDIGALPYSGDPTVGLQGTLFADTTLSGFNTVLGDLTVPAGVTLTVAPGATLSFATTDGMGSGFDPGRAELAIQGTLLAQGTSGSRIAFTTPGGNGAWYGIRIAGGSGTSIGQADISKAVYGVTFGTSGSLTYSTVSNTTSGGIWVQGGVVTLSHLTLSSNARMAIYAPGGVTNLSHSLVTSSGNNSDAAVVLFYQSTLDHNTIAGNNGTAVYFSGYSPAGTTLQDNIIANNNGYGVYRTTYTTGQVAASYNDTWGNIPSDYSGIGAGVGSIFTNPLFVGGGDYRLQAGSPCRGRASDGSDMGAFPYGS
ncbi:MAG TPA: right-handed parallel beta-helix repeat-containing protein, partial [Myxococcales bacterium]|nr:right-handed parallel beta-helix repeat-containing protein [Myxococcales bacterium]